MPTAYLSCTYCALQALFIYYYLLLVIYVLYMQSVCECGILCYVCATVYALLMLNTNEVPNG